MRKLSRESILEIYKDESGTYKELGRKYGVSASCITHIKTGERHSSITGATEQSSSRRKNPQVNKAKTQAVIDYLTDPDEPRSKEDAAIYFDLPLYTIRRVLKDYAKKYRIKYAKK